LARARSLAAAAAFALIAVACSAGDGGGVSGTSPDPAGAAANDPVSDAADEVATTLEESQAEVVEAREANSPLRIVFNVLWLVLFGWEIALAHLFSALFLTITILGIPFAKQHIKLVPLSLFPFGRNLL